MKSLPILLALGCLFFPGCETVQKVAETQSAQIPEADEEPLGGNFLINFVNPMNGARMSPELRLNEEGEGFSGSVIFPRGESPLKNVGSVVSKIMAQPLNIPAIKRTKNRNMLASFIFATSHQALFPLMRLFSFILLLLGLTQVMFFHSGRTDTIGGHWDRKAGRYHYQNQTTAPRPSTSHYSLPYPEIFY